MNIRSLALFLSVCAIISTVLVANAADKPKALRVLLVTGDDVEPAHDWYHTSQALRDVLVESGKFQVRIVEDASMLDSATLDRYDVMLLNYYNAKTPTLSAASKANLLKFVDSGKGLVITHLSSASFKEWPEYQKLCGRFWVMGKSGHGPRSVFKAKVANGDHPITKGLEDFETDDELYAKLQGDGPINVLVSADSDWSHQTEPLVFTVDHGKGRIFHTAFGHDAKAVKHPSVQTLLVRGCQWAATGQVD